MNTRCVPAGLILMLLPVIAHSQQHTPMQHERMNAEAVTAPMSDERQWVKVPEALRAHMLANMRDHLKTLNRLHGLLGSGRFEEAADLAEQRLGLQSLQLHGASRIGPYMPKRMAEIGTGMHKAASRFALAARDAAVNGNVSAALSALADVTAQCVACHDGYRVQ